MDSLESISVVTPGRDSQDIPLHDLRPNTQPVPQSQYRHAAQSGPWSWMDFGDVDLLTAMTATHATVTHTTATHTREWEYYPQNLFGNWTQTQVERSQMLAKCSKSRLSTIYCMDVGDDGKFTNSDVTRGGHGTVPHPRPLWDILRGKRPENIRVRSLFVDHLTEPVLKMLGTKYNIEPFFFTSSVNWIPSRYQEALNHGEGDHITITLPFVRTFPTPAGSHSHRSTNNQINTQEPLPLPNGHMLSMDLLAIHMVRNVESSTIISYHPESTSQSASLSPAKRLHSLMLLVGYSVYWQNIFSKSKDPTFLFLAVLWYALYTWDESLESLYNHVRSLESDVLTESRIEHTRDLHTLQAYLLHYESLLHGFQLSVTFIKKNPNPAMESQGIYDEQRSISNELMQKECENLLSEIDRLEQRRAMLGKQLKNIIDIALASDIRDSASMRQITYLTMIFLPANLISSVFGMNVMEINPGTLWTLGHYVEVTIAVTVLAFYIVVTLHTSFHEKGAKLQRRAAWPILLLWRAVERMKNFLIPQEKSKRV